MSQMSAPSITLKTATLLAFSSFAAFASAAVKPAILRPAQQFQQPSVILTGSWLVGIESADLNNDGHPDLVYTDYGATSTSSTTHILLNNGDGTFTPGQTIATAGASIAVADFDRDGHPDIEWVWSVLGECRVYFAHGNGDGTFAPTVQLGTFAQIGTNLPALSYLTAAPMHDIGYLDLLVEDTANSSLFELTAGPSGTLIRLYGIRLPDGTGPMTTADLNGDGHTDLIIQSNSPGSSGVIDVFTGSADGLLTGPATYSGPNGVRSFLLQDIDADAHPDLILEGANGTLAILHGFPDGTFSTTSSGGTNTLDPTTGAGGHLIALTGNHLYTATPAGISLLQSSNLSLTLQGIFNAGPSPSSSTTSYVVADFNNDGTPDIALDSPEGIAILFANPDGTLQTSLSFSANKPALTGIITGTDALITTSATEAKLLPGHGDGTFGQPTTIAAPTPPTPATLDPNLPGLPIKSILTPTSIITTDLDNDGHADVIAVFDNPTADHAHPDPNTPNQLYIWYGNPDGTFTSPTILTPTRNFTQVAAADMTNDGQLDLILTDGYLAAIIRNLGSRTFGSEQHLLAGSNITSISTADLNNDGTTDLVLSNGKLAASTNPVFANPDVATGGITVLPSKLTTKAVISTTTVLSITTGLLISYGVNVDGIAQVTAADNSQLTGNITFYDGATSICTTSVTGPAACPPNAGSGFAAGKHNLTAVYGGDATHAGSTSNIATVTVVPDVTSATLTSSLNPASTGQSVILTAALTGDTVTPIGPVTFLDGNTTIGTAVLDSTGRATLTTSALTAGTHSLTVVYAATQNFLGSTSPAVSQVITPASITAATTTMISSSANPASPGQSITLTANVVTATQSTLIPTGTVTFLENTPAGNTILGTATLNSSGVATFTTSTFATGTHGIIASYGGNSAAAPSLSSVLLQVINAPTTTVSPSFIIGAGSTSVATGASANVLVKVSPVNGFDQPVQLSCANLPTEASCTFAATTIAAGGGTTTLKLTTLAPRACGSSTPYGQTTSGQSASLASTLAIPSLAGLLIFLLPKRRRALKSLLTLIAMCGAIALTGCGACTDLGTRPGTYTIQVTGTSMGSTQVTVTQNVQVTVTE